MGKFQQLKDLIQFSRTLTHYSMIHFRSVTTHYKLRSKTFLRCILDHLVLPSPSIKRPIKKDASPIVEGRAYNKIKSSTSHLRSQTQDFGRQADPSLQAKCVARQPAAAALCLLRSPRSSSPSELLDLFPEAPPLQLSSSALSKQSLTPTRK